MTRFIDPNMVIVKPRFREELGDIDKLAEDIKLTGQLNPIMVEETEEGLVLLQGHRRLEACRKLNRPVWISTTKDANINIDNDLHRRRIELMENIARKDFSPVEQAKLIAEVDRLMRDIYGDRAFGKPASHKGEDEGWGFKETAAMLGYKSHGTVSSAVLLAKAADTMPEVREAKTINEALSLVKRRLKEEARSELIRRSELKLEKTDFDPRKFYEEKVMLGDCLELMKGMPEGFVDYFVTDPPFGLGLDKISKSTSLQSKILGTYEDIPSEIFKLLNATIHEMARIGKPNCWVYMMCGVSEFCILKEFFAQAGFSVGQKPIIWVKAGVEPLRIIPGVCSHPAYWPASTYETILMARRGTNALAQQGQPDVIICPPVPPSDKRHWVERPLPLLINLIQRLHHPGTKAILMDPFCGSGSTLVAAYRFDGITALGCELDPANRSRAIDYLIEDYIERQQTLEDWGDLTDG